MMTTYTATFYMGKPCTTIGCSCNTGQRVIIYSHKPSKESLIKAEPGLERVEVVKKQDGKHVSIQAFKRVHKGINGRKTDGFTNWFGVLK